MSGAILTLTHDPAAGGSIALGIAASAHLGVPLVLTDRAVRELIRELGGPEAAGRYLFDLATAAGKPIACNLETGPDRSETHVLAPDSWTDEKTLGWVGGMRPHLERAFGEMTLRPNRAERRRRRRKGRRN
jgi:hypothetical protein